MIVAVKKVISGMENFQGAQRPVYRQVKIRAEMKEKCQEGAEDRTSAYEWMMENFLKPLTSYRRLAGHCF